MSEITAEVVRLAYRLFLNREAESDAVVQEKANSHKTYQELRNAFLTSPEFQGLHDFHNFNNQEIARTYWQRPAIVEVDVPPSALEVLISRVREQWRKLGENEPYWSVLSHDDFRTQNMGAQSLIAFYESGRSAAHLINLFEEKTDTKIKQGTCFELGCGVGRVTAYLAQRFDRVIATDISPGNLALCQQRMRELGIKNVETLLLPSPEDISKIGRFEFFYSVIVLQHNPPPVQKVLLNKIFSQISRGGGCLFQTPGTLPNYSFSVEAYLRSTEEVIDMHCLPKPIVLNLLRSHGLQLRDLELDPWTGAFGSYTYFAIK